MTLNCQSEGRKALAVAFALTAGTVSAETSKAIPTVTVDPDFTVARVIQSGPFSLGELERNVYFRSYHPPGKFSEERNRELLEIGAMPARGSYVIGLPEPVEEKEAIADAMGKGKIHNSHFPDETYTEIYGRMCEETAQAPHALAHGGFPSWMREEFDRRLLEGPREDWEQISFGNVPRKEYYDVLAEGVVRLFQHWKEAGVAYPKYYTVQNEPIWRWETGDLAEFHNLVSERMREEHPDVLVGGPCYAWPYPGGNWSGWEQPRQFIELSGGKLGFYDMHFYSKGDWSLPPEPEWQRRRVEHPSLYRSQRLGVGTVWDFGRLEGYLDLWNAFHLTTWDGEWKPMVVSEFGRQGIHPQFGPWTNDFKPFLYMNTVIRMWMTFMERPDIKLTVPFILGESDLPYVPRRGMAIYTRPRAAHSSEFLELARRRGQGVIEVDPNEDDPTLERTRFHDFYRFFSDIEGKRVPVVAESEDVPTVERMFFRAFRNGNVGYVWIHNGGAYLRDPVRIDLGAISARFGEALDSIGVKRMYFEGPIPDPAYTGEIEGTLRIDGPDEYRAIEGGYFDMAGEETAVIRVTFREIPEVRGIHREINLFAKETAQPLSNGDPVRLTFQVDEEIATLAETVVLGIGFARDDGFEGTAEIRINGGRAGEVDLSGSAGIRNYHRVHSVPVPAALVRAGENRVDILVDGQRSGGDPRLVSGRMTLHTFGPTQ